MHLYASQNAFTCALFPAEVSSFRHLRTLDVSFNSVASLSFSPDFRLPALQELDVSGNRLADLPDGLFQSSQLAVLLAADNALIEVPAELHGLQNLKTANFGCNNIRTVGECILEMPGLERLVLSGNPLRDRTHLSMSLQELRLSLRRKFGRDGETGERGSSSGAVQAMHVEQEEESFF